jgi:hypothetical protein
MENEGNEWAKNSPFFRHNYWHNVIMEHVPYIAFIYNR